MVGFSGRIFDKESAEGKYINTPNTILYDKSRILYLWDQAKNEVRRQDACILVEGQMDALMSHQAGVVNAVATSGTALTRGHLGLVKRLGSKILLAFDTDSAGELAARRAVELAFEEGLEVGIIEIPQGKDPAETICEDPLGWRKAVESAKPVIAYFLDNLKKKFQGDLHKLRGEAKIILLPYLVRLEDEIEKAHWVQELSKTLGLREEPLWLELGKLAAKAKKGETRETGESPAESAGFGPGTRRHLVEGRILGLVAWKGGEFLEKLGEKQKTFFSEESQILREHLFEDTPSPAGGELKIRLSKLALEAELLYEGLEDLSGEFQKLWGELEGEVARARLEFLSGEIRRTELAGEKERLAQHLKEFQETSQRLNYLWQESRAKN